MELNQIDLLVLNETSSISKEALNEQEGSLMAIEQPQEKNTYNLAIPELEIKQANDVQKLMPRIPFGFFSHVQENRRKYIY